MAVNNIQNANLAMWRELNHPTGVDAVHERGVARFEPPIRPGFRISAGGTMSRRGKAGDQKPHDRRTKNEKVTDLTHSTRPVYRTHGMS